MNNTQQRERHTQIGDLERKLEVLAEALDAELIERIAEIRETVSDERIHRLKLAEEQRLYIDSGYRALRTVEKEQVDSLEARLNARLTIFESLTFYGRLLWIFTGRRG